MWCWGRRDMERTGPRRAACNGGVGRTIYKPAGEEGSAEGRCTSFSDSLDLPTLKGSLVFLLGPPGVLLCPAGSQFSVVPSHPTLWSFSRLR